MKIFLISLIIIFCAINSPSAKPTNSGALIVIIEGFENNRGQALCHLFNTPQGYPDESEKCFKSGKSTIDKKSARIVFGAVPFGSYALTTHHDANLNGVMDKTFFGLPDEGYGISNNPEVLLSLPDFADCRFDFRKDGQEVIIKMKY
ncbi:MAG: DUF2141 domain-containing protein [Candidatus Kapaibacterium sp.]